MERTIIMCSTILSTSCLIGNWLQMLNSPDLNYKITNGFAKISTCFFMNIVMLDVLDRYIKVN